MVDDYEVNGDRGWIRRAVDDTGTGAVRIYGVGPGARGPILCWRVSTEDDVIHLSDMSTAIIVLKNQATDRQVRVEDGALDGESVITGQCPVRASSMREALRKD